MRAWIAAVGWAGIGAVCLGAGPQAADLNLKSGQAVAFLGDSITQQGVRPGGYVSLVGAGLKAAGYDVTIIGAGISGHKSDNMLERVDRDVIGKKPDWMLLSCGVNDVGHGPRGVPLDAYKTNIAAIVGKAQAAGIRVMILTATVFTENLESEGNRKLSAYNEFLRSLAKEKGCLLADLNADFRTLLQAKMSPENLLTTDGVHMNERGNQVMARGVLRAFGLDEAQMGRVEEAWLDLPGTCDWSPSLQGTLKLTLRQAQALDALAARHNLKGPQLARLLYGAAAFGVQAGADRAALEAFLAAHAAEDPAAILQAGLTHALSVLLSEGAAKP